MIFIVVVILAAQADSSFGAGGDPLHYSNVACDGTELSLAACSKIIDSDLITCTHAQDIGVTCEEACTNGEVASCRWYRCNQRSF